MKYKIAIIGLGYVGLPLAVEFSKKFTVVGFDTNQKRIESLKNGYDRNREVSNLNLKSNKKLKYTYNSSDIKNCNIYIITVPTPVNNFNKPDLKYLKDATKIVGSIIKKNDLIIYESTVYPGTIEEVCVPMLISYSSLRFNKDFYCGYSPERINPGDKKYTLTAIKKITSGSTPKIALKVDSLYKNIIKAGTHMVQSIKIAEAAKIIENTQRDINIALINEFTIIFNKLGIDSNSVLDAAATKWNFLPFKPGLVGGHCISVDPYYLAYKAKKIGINPKIILSGRKINDQMPYYIIDYVKKAMKDRSIKFAKSNLLIMGFTFKENCPDIRNTKIINLVNGFKKHRVNVDIFDPVADNHEVFNEFQLKLIDKPIVNKYDTILIAVAHDVFKSIKIRTLLKLCKKNYVIYDLKNILKSDSRITKL